MPTSTRDVTLKLTVAFVDYVGDNSTRITLFPDFSDDWNKAWSEFTPAAAMLNMTVKNEFVEDILKPGSNVLVTLSPED